ncbi:unnamed protein product [Mycena citricolor]|uniref:Uncharacterized protein n=1 Tax=Mycena citricolor TaxID=2018698 RepID=A0AAD2HF41_9AGAR|nr:unnamed protein product [Mycena citricolor]
MFPQSTMNHGRSPQPSGDSTYGRTELHESPPLRPIFTPPPSTVNRPQRSSTTRHPQDSSTSMS